MRAVARFFGRVAWCLLGAWAALAFYFTAPVPLWLATGGAVVVGLLFLISLRDRWFGRHQFWRSGVALAVAAGVMVWYFGFVTPENYLNWTTKHARNPCVRVDGDKVYVKNVRNFSWRTFHDYDEAYYERTYDLNAINSMDYILSPISELDGIAHVWVSFGFADGQYVSVSVEARGIKERSYGLLRSMFRQFQLIYVVGDERDVVGLRGAVWQNQVRVYPAASTDERKRALFVDMMTRAASLEQDPEFYNLFFNNCMNNITYHVRRLGGRPLPNDLWLLLTGFSDRKAYEWGFLDTPLPFALAHQAYRLDEWMRTTPLDETFSRRLREQRAKQVAEALAGKTAG